MSSGVGPHAKSAKAAAGCLAVFLALAVVGAIGEWTGLAPLPTPEPQTPPPVWAQPGVEDAVARMRYCLGSMYPESESATPTTPAECGDVPVLGHQRIHRQKACEMATGGKWWCSQFGEPNMILPGPVTPKPSPQPLATERPSGAPAPRTILLNGPAQPDYQPRTEHLKLESGSYTLHWSAMGPFKVDEFGTICGVSIDLSDSSGEGYGGVTKTLETPSNGTVTYRNIVAGDYELFIYIGCAWSIQLVGP